MTTSAAVSEFDQIRSLRRTCPFTAHDIAKVTGDRMREEERALLELLQHRSGLTYAVRELAD